MTDKRIMVKDKYELTIEETSFVEDVRNIISTAKEHTYNTTPVRDKIAISCM